MRAVSPEGKQYPVVSVFGKYSLRLFSPSAEALNIEIVPRKALIGMGVFDHMPDGIEDHRCTVIKGIDRPLGHCGMIGIAGMGEGKPGFTHVGFHVPRFGPGPLIIRNIAEGKGDFHGVGGFQDLINLK